MFLLCMRVKSQKRSLDVCANVRCGRLHLRPPIRFRNNGGDDDDALATVGVVMATARMPQL